MSKLKEEEEEEIIIFPNHSIFDNETEEKIRKRIEGFEDLMTNSSSCLNIDKQKEYGILKKIQRLNESYKELSTNVSNHKIIIKENLDSELSELLLEEMREMDEKRKGIYEEYLEILYSSTEDNIDGIVIEIRCGAGGREAALFALDLFEMYKKFANHKRWKTKVDSISETEDGGIREAIITIENKEAYDLLQYESGVHRVQRVPETESLGRVHTSTATVAVLPKLNKITKVDIDQKDLIVDVFRSSGAGGQSVNTTDSAVRITHKPTGIKAESQKERSQHSNKETAMATLKMRILQKMIQDQMEEVCAERLKKIGKGERCEKIRTYNFPQDRVTDHRINYSIFNIHSFMNGEELEKICKKMRNLSKKTILEKYEIITR